MDFFHVFKFSQEQTFFFSLILHVLCFCCFRTISHLFSRPSPSNTRMLDIAPKALILFLYEISGVILYPFIQYGSSISRSSKRIFSRAFVIYCDLSEMFVIRPHAPSEKKPRLGDCEKRERKEIKILKKKKFESSIEITQFSHVKFRFLSKS